MEKKKTTKVFKKPPMGKVVICGMGVMGASLGHTLVHKRLATEVYGLIRRMDTQQEILRLRLADQASDDPAEALKEAQMVILAIPSSFVPEQLTKILPFLKKDTIVTDLCSVKQSIVQICQKILKKRALYIGAHPMTGTEKFGYENFIPDLYANTPLILTPIKSTSPKAITISKKFWNTLNTRILMMSPKQHDRCAALISHLPHVISYLLMTHVYKKEIKLPMLFKMSAGSFRDMTRISGSSPDLWLDIFMHNQKTLSQVLKNFNKDLAIFTGKLEGSDNMFLHHVLKKAYSAKKIFDQHTKNM